jgi:predicted DNA-binding transcriptional regulator YafY
MPINRNKLGRLIVIHECLSTLKPHTWQQLAAACEYRDLVRERPCRRTVIDDIIDLREAFGAPIPRYCRKGYHYERPFSLFEVLNPADAALLHEGLALMRQFSALPAFSGLEEVLRKFEERAGVVGTPRKPVVMFDQNEQYAGLGFLGVLYEAVRDTRVVRIQYRDFAGRSFWYHFSPYLLRQFNLRWYVFGTAPTEGDRLLNLALDRIQTATPDPALSFRPNPGVDFGVYFQEFVGVTRPADQAADAVRLRVWKPRAFYVLTKPVHPSQEVLAETDETIDFGFRVLLNPELEARLLELGADAEVLAPEALRERMRVVVGGMGERYRRSS